MSVLTVGAAGAGGAYDYTCDGTDDHVEILAAIAAVGSGDTVQLSAGTFACAANITLPVGVSLIGTPATILQFPLYDVLAWSGGNRIIVQGSNAVADLRLTGSIGVTVTGSDVACDRITSTQQYHPYYAFRIYPPADTTIENIAFTDCHAVNTSGHGFIGDGTTNRENILVKDVTFTRCTATGCGAANDCRVGDETYGQSYAPWICGFIVLESYKETFTGENIRLIDCEASGCWESGFYHENDTIIVGGEMIRCTSTNNGVKPSPVFGAGFMLTHGFALTDCISVGNQDAYYFSWTFWEGHLDGPIAMTRCTATAPTRHGIWLHGSSPWARFRFVTIDDCTIANVLAPNHVIWLDYVQDAAITDLRVIDCTGDVYEPTYLPNPENPGQPVASINNTITYCLEPFAAAPAAPVAGETVAFSNRLPVIKAPPAGWSWDFGDGDGSADQYPTHTFAAPGPYVVAHTAGGNTVSQTVTVVPGVSYGGARLSEADLAPLDHDPIAQATDLQNGRVGLQGSPVSRRAWTIDALADDHGEIEALAALKGQHLTLNINGVEYPGVMIRPPMLETQLTPSAWAYQIGLVQETRR